MEDFIDDTADYDQEVSNEIRKLFKYNPEKYKNIDDDDIDNMEADYETIMKEERRTYNIKEIYSQLIFIYSF